MPKRNLFKNNSKPAVLFIFYIIAKLLKRENAYNLLTRHTVINSCANSTTTLITSKQKYIKMSQFFLKMSINRMQT